MLAPLVVLLGARADLVITSGTNIVSADIGASKNPAKPPAVPSSRNVFFDTLNPVTNSTGNLGAQGWSGLAWIINAGRLLAQGSSTQKFNGAVGVDGHVYGWGRARFDVTFETDRAYAYVTNTALTGVSGIAGASGILAPGVHRIQGFTYGGTGGFSMDYALTPASADAAEVLRGAISAPIIERDEESHRDVIIITFRPGNGDDLQTAAAKLGVDHFNFVSHITSVPPGWQIVDRGQVVVPGDGTFPAEGLTDPLPHASEGSGRVVYVPSRPSPIRIEVEAAKDIFDDTTGGYYNEKWVVNDGPASPNRPNPYELRFIDSPDATPGILQPNEFKSYRTQLVGEDANGNVVKYFGDPIDWWSDQVCDDHGSASGDIHFSTLPDEPSLGPTLTGGLHVGLPPIAVSWQPAPIIYGQTLGTSVFNALASAPGSFAYSLPETTILTAGPHELSVVFTPADATASTPITNTLTLVVAPAPLTVRANNVRRAAGTPNPSFDGVITGLVNGDPITATYSCAATTNSPLGAYPILPALTDPTGRLTNYVVTIVNGTLTVAPEPENVMQNGGFEEGAAGWSFVGNAGVTTAPHTGRNAGFVNIAAGTASRPVATVPGHVYEVTFWLSSNGFSGPDATISSSFGDGFGVTNTYPAGAFAYRRYRYLAIASGVETTFRYSGRMNGGTYFFDDVSVLDLGNSTNGVAILAQPASLIVVPGANASFQVGAYSAQPIRYQWYQNETHALPDATNDFLNLTAVDAIQAGSYHVVLSTSAGQAVSAPATLAVLGVPVSFGTDAGALGLFDDGFHTRILNLTGQGTIVIEASSDLLQWLPISTNAPGFGAVDVIDTEAISFPLRFYRAIIVQP